MSEIKYVTPSGLAHYDEKIKEVIDEVDTSTNTKVTQTPTSSNETYPLLLSPTGQTSEANTTSYFNSDVVLNPSTKTISANIDGNAKTATSATSADSATKDASGNVITETYSKTNHTHNYAGSSSVGGAATTALACTGNSATATKLATARTIQTDLASTSSASFDGRGNVTPGVKGTLPVTNGGTGKTTLVDSANALINSLTTGSSDPEDDDYFVSQYAGGEQDTFHRRPVSALWNYIKGKISSVLGLTASSYGGNAKTATSATSADSATKATQDASGNVITSTYAKKSIYNDTVVSMGRKSGTTVGTNSFAYGKNVTASGKYSHAEGWSTTAIEDNSHAEGYGTTAGGGCSHAEGYGTTALDFQHAQGHYNNTTTALASTFSGTTTSGTVFVIGNGTSSSPSNAFRVTDKGQVYAPNTTIMAGADYAEYFEWSDENPNKDDRVGYFVTFDENNPEKIRFANEDDYILGIVSGMPCVIGNGDEDWKKRYILDDFGRYIEEAFEYEETEIDPETGEETTVTKTGTKWKENPDYDKTKPYVQRDQRPEWSAVGMFGVLSVRDDGTCQVNGYCKCTDSGIATACEKGEGAYRVIKRITDNIVKVVLK